MANLGMIHGLMVYESFSGGIEITLWLFNIAMEAPWPIEIDGLPIESMVDLSMANC